VNVGAFPPPVAMRRAKSSSSARNGGMFGATDAYFANFKGESVTRFVRRVRRRTAHVDDEVAVGDDADVFGVQRDRASRQTRTVVQQRECAVENIAGEFAERVAPLRVGGLAETGDPRRRAPRRTNSPGRRGVEEPSSPRRHRARVKATSRARTLRGTPQLVAEPGDFDLPDSTRPRLPAADPRRATAYSFMRTLVSVIAVNPNDA